MCGDVRKNVQKKEKKERKEDVMTRKRKRKLHEDIHVCGLERETEMNRTFLTDSGNRFLYLYQSIHPSMDMKLKIGIQVPTHTQLECYIFKVTKFPWGLSFFFLFSQ